MSWRARVAGRDLAVDIVARRPDLRVDLGGDVLDIRERPREATEFELEVDGVTFRGWRYATADETYVRTGGRTFIIERPRDEAGGQGADQARHEVHADMPGVVIEVHCSPGQVVAAGDRLVTLESMKLQITLVAHRAGRIEAVHVVPGGAFERGALLVSLAREAQP